MTKLRLTKMNSMNCLALADNFRGICLSIFPSVHDHSLMVAYQ